MKLLEQIKQWWSDFVKDREEKQAVKKQKALERMSCEVVNVMEFDGKLYVSHNGVPVVPVESLNITVEKLLAQSRKSYLAWQTKFGNRYGKI